MCWNKWRLCWKISKLFYFCRLKKFGQAGNFWTLLRISWKVCWNKGRLCWKIAKSFYFCRLKTLVRPETFGPHYVSTYASIQFYDAYVKDLYITVFLNINFIFMDIVTLYTRSYKLCYLLFCRTELVAAKLYSVQLKVRSVGEMVKTLKYWEKQILYSVTSYHNSHNVLQCEWTQVPQAIESWRLTNFGKQPQGTTTCKVRPRAFQGCCWIGTGNCWWVKANWRAWRPPLSLFYRCPECLYTLRLSLRLATIWHDSEIQCGKEYVANPRRIKHQSQYVGRSSSKVS